MPQDLKPSIVRVDFFKPSGKWYTTEYLPWVGGYYADIHEAFAQTLRENLAGRLADMDAVCLEPVHTHAHPIQIKAGRWLNGKY